MIIVSLSVSSDLLVFLRLELQFRDLEWITEVEVLHILRICCLHYEHNLSSDVFQSPSRMRQQSMLDAAVVGLIAELSYPRPGRVIHVSCGETLLKHAYRSLLATQIHQLQLHRLTSSPDAPFGSLTGSMLRDARRIFAGGPLAPCHHPMRVEFLLTMSHIIALAPWTDNTAPERFLLQCFSLRLLAVEVFSKSHSNIQHKYDERARAKLVVNLAAGMLRALSLLDRRHDSCCLFKLRWLSRMIFRAAVSWIVAVLPPPLRVSVLWKQMTAGRGLDVVDEFFSWRGATKSLCSSPRERLEAKNVVGSALILLHNLNRLELPQLDHCLVLLI